MTLDQAIAVRAAQLAGKSVEPSLLAQAIELIRTMPKQDTKQLRGKYKPKPVAANPWGLSDRERHVLAMLVDGDTMVSIARRWGLGKSSVVQYMSRARTKMRVRTTISAVLAFDRHARHHADGETMIGNP